MKSLEQYIEESLLDDIDDLEKDADDIVDKKSSFGGEYYVNYVMVYNLGSTLKELDKTTLKKLTPKYKDEYKIYNQKGDVAKNPNTKYIDTLVRCIMDLENYDNKFEVRLDEFLKTVLKCAFTITGYEQANGKCIRIQLYNGFDEIEIYIKKR